MPIASVVGARVPRQGDGRRQQGWHADRQLHRHDRSLEVQEGDRVAEEGDRAEGRIAGIERKLEGSPSTDTELFALEVGGELRGTRIRTGRMERLRLGMPVLLRTLLSQRAPSGRRNYVYDGEGSVIGVTDTAGELQTSYSYDPYGHPPTLSSLGDENPFGYRGAYTAGVQAVRVICGGPSLLGTSYYDGEDGRNTQLASYIPGFRLPAAADIATMSGTFCRTPHSAGSSGGA